MDVKSWMIAWLDDKDRGQRSEIRDQKKIRDLFIICEICVICG